ncbi:hypothetical protein ACHAXT_009463 [Thalassiosira profunda]
MDERLVHIEKFKARADPDVTAESYANKIGVGGKTMRTWLTDEDLYRIVQGQGNGHWNKLPQGLREEILGEDSKRYGDGKSLKSKRGSKKSQTAKNASKTTAKSGKGDGEKKETDSAAGSERKTVNERLVIIDEFKAARLADPDVKIEAWAKKNADRSEQSFKEWLSDEDLYREAQRRGKGDLKAIPHGLKEKVRGKDSRRYGDNEASKTLNERLVIIDQFKAALLEDPDVEIEAWAKKNGRGERCFKDWLKDEDLYREAQRQDKGDLKRIPQGLKEKVRGSTWWEGKGSKRKGEGKSKSGGKSHESKKSVSPQKKARTAKSDGPSDLLAGYFAGYGSSSEEEEENDRSPQKKARTAKSDEGDGKAAKTPPSEELDDGALLSPRSEEQNLGDGASPPSEELDDGALLSLRSEEQNLDDDASPPSEKQKLDDGASLRSEEQKLDDGASLRSEEQNLDDDALLSSFGGRDEDVFASEESGGVEQDAAPRRVSTSPENAPGKAEDAASANASGKAEDAASANASGKAGDAASANAPGKAEDAASANALAANAPKWQMMLRSDGSAIYYWDPVSRTSQEEAPEGVDAVGVFVCIKCSGEDDKLVILPDADGLNLAIVRWAIEKQWEEMGSFAFAPFNNGVLPQMMEKKFGLEKLKRLGLVGNGTDAPYEVKVVMG